jgi:hypothetical protein
MPAMRALLHAFGLVTGLLCTACSTPAPRIPFRDSAWHASILAGPRRVNEFTPDADGIGIEFVLGEPGTGGWATEVGLRYAEGEGDGNRYAIDPATGDRTLLVDSDREQSFYELSFGVRQALRASDVLQPYFGVGGVLQYAQSEETWIQPQALPNPGIPQIDHERSKYRPGIYTRVGLVWNVLRDQFRESTEVPISLDARGVIGVETSYVELTLGVGFGR